MAAACVIIIAAVRMNAAKKVCFCFIDPPKLYLSEILSIFNNIQKNLTIVSNYFQFHKKIARQKRTRPLLPCNACRYVFLAFNAPGALVGSLFYFTTFNFTTLVTFVTPVTSATSVTSAFIGEG